MNGAAALTTRNSGSIRWPTKVRRLCLLRCLVTRVELAPVKRMVAERSQGNPFFIEEIIQALFDEGVLVRNGTVTVARELSQVHLPATVQGILAARIDRLPPVEKEMLQTLAVIGKEFPLGLVREATGRPEDELERILHHLQLGEFIHEQPAFPEVEYSFKHALTQEVAYNSVLSGTPADTARTHRRGDREALRRPSRRPSYRIGASFLAQLRHRQSGGISAQGRPECGAALHSPGGA